MTFPANAVDYGAIVNSAINAMRAVRSIASAMISSSAASGLDISGLNSLYQAMQRQRSTLLALEDRVQTADNAALNAWATANLRLPDGTAYAGTFSADYVAGKDALSGFFGWLEGLFPVATSLELTVAAGGFQQIAPIAWASNSAQAIALRSHLQTVVDTIADG